jgi:hypothetical protein
MAMSTTNHTAITTGAQANASVINAPLGQLDAAIGNLATLTTSAKTSAVEALNELDGALDALNGSNVAPVLGDDSLPGLPVILRRDIVAAGNYDIVIAGGPWQVVDIWAIKDTTVGTVADVLTLYRTKDGIGYEGLTDTWIIGGMNNKRMAPGKLYFSIGAVAAGDVIRIVAGGSNPGCACLILLVRDGGGD